jgi:hypothetical protein
MASRVGLAGAVAFLLLGLVGSGPARAAGVELEGTWHVLVHFKDSAAKNAEEERWEDRVWVFTREGEGLRWSDYPIVVLDDEEGRFERSSTNRASRVLDYWEPNAGQLAELAAGPKVNARGSRAKLLRASGSGWASKAGAAPQSATTITFSASWTIEDAATLPVFRLEDALGSAMTDSLEGATVYATERVEEDGRVLRGRFDRDGTRTGTFRLLRTAPVRGLGTTEEQEQRIAGKRQQMFVDQYFGGDAGLALGGVSPDFARRAREGELSESERSELRGQIQASLEAQLQDRGLSPSQAEPQIQSLTRQIEKLVLEGKEPAEIERLYRDGKLRP